jgi:hypothetical protein
MDVGPQQAFAHRDLPPDSLDNLRVRDQPLRVLHKVTKDGERLTTKLHLFAVAPETLSVEIQPERGKGEQLSL